MAIDTLAYAKHLEAAGVGREQAEAHAEALNQHIFPDLATKQELDSLRADMKAEFAVTRSDLQKSIYQAQLQSVALIGVMLGILFALIKLVP
jgi:hypothetical protein